MTSTRKEVSEKHRALARSIVSGFMTNPLEGKIDLSRRIAAALAKVERDTFKRAADIAKSKYTIDTVHKKVDGKPYSSGAIAIEVAGRISADILSEAGEV